MTNTTMSSLFTGISKFSRVLRRIKEILILISAHVIADSPDARHIQTLLARIPETLISSKSFYVVHIGELLSRRFT